MRIRSPVLPRMTGFPTTDPVEILKTPGMLSTVFPNDVDCKRILFLPLILLTSRGEVSGSEAIGLPVTTIGSDSITVSSRVKSIFIIWFI